MTDTRVRNLPALDGLETLQARTLGLSHVCIAILDGPVDTSHPCFQGEDLTILNGFSPSSQGDQPAQAHGTHVASIIFGQQGSPVSGIAPQCKGLILPVFSDCEDGSVKPCGEIDMARAITLAVGRGANIINISGGSLSASGQASSFLNDAIEHCRRHNVLVIAAAGNDGCDCLHIPAALEGVLVVGAVDGKGDPVDFSNWGGAYRHKGVLAPGTNILGALPGGGVVRRNGTSFAAPIVSGIAGLLMSLQYEQSGKMDAKQAARAILDGAVVCDPSGRDDCTRYLAGTLDITGAVSRISDKSGAIPSPVPSETKFFNSTLTRRSASVMKDEAIIPTPKSPQEPVVAAVLSEQSEQMQLAGSGPLETAIEVQEMVQEEHVELSSAAPAEATPTSRPTVPQPVPPPLADQLAPAGKGLPSSSMLPSACCAACAGKGPPQHVYALGSVGYDFGTEARMDGMQVEMGDEGIALDPVSLAAHLTKHPEQSTAVIWTLNLDVTPIYAIQPFGAFAAETYKFLRESLTAQFKPSKSSGPVERIFVPGVVSGSVRLLNGMEIPLIVPELRGMYSWNTRALVGELKKLSSGKEAGDPLNGLQNFLWRIYEEVRNLGLTPEERALNYAATNAFQLNEVFTKARGAGLDIAEFKVVKSPICRPDSDCWDIHLTFFQPENVLQTAREIWMVTVDISDIVPVPIGQTRHWTTY